MIEMGDRCIVPAASRKGGLVEQWVDAWQAGADPEGNFRRLFDRYAGAVFAFFRKRGLSPQECDDLVQETFLGVHRGLVGFRREVPFESWLFELATNTFRKALRFRSAKKRSGGEGSLEDGSGPRSVADSAGVADAREIGEAPWVPRLPPSALGSLLGKERLRKVLEGLGQLPPQMRRCATLAWCDGYSNREIATLLKISPQTVKVQHLKARKRLRECLPDPIGEGMGE